MGELPLDVRHYIEQRFSQRDHERVFTLLDQEHLRTPRVIRSVLYLANGSVALLKHHIDVCRNDLAAILMHAEYVVGVSKEPLPVRDMSFPYGDERNVGDSLADHLHASSRPPPAPSGRRHSVRRYHQQLVNETFYLGDVRYVISSIQTHPNEVRCYRFHGLNSRIAQLPLVFVMEQLAETVELAEATAY